MRDGAVRLGLLTPSSNTVLEPVTAALIADLPQVSAHFSRFKVTEIALSESALGQFDDSQILTASCLLADAKVDVICWIGTSASWLGFERDEILIRRIQESTGIRACTCVLAFQEVFEKLGVSRIGLVTPYTDDVQARICDVWGREGLDCLAERHLGIRENFSFGTVEQTTIESMVRDVAKMDVEAAAIVCTNLRGASAAPLLEAELGIPVIDSVAVTLWKCLKETGVPTESLAKWGRIFALP